MAFSVGAGVASISKNIDKAEAATYTQTVNQYYSTSQQSGDAAIDWDQTGATLKTNLYKKIKISSAGWSYNGLWDCYENSDTRANGTLWDIYSDDTAYTQSSPHSGTSGHSGEGDFVNREHMIPQSIFDEAAPMVSDAHHVYPSDGYINGMRSNHPHGNVSSATQTSNSGCKLGTGPTTGSTKVFEPMAKYKGDIARTYFYFVTCYENKLSSFDTFEAFSKNTYPSISSTYLAIYLQWAKDDPVDQKEIDRNNAIYKGQGNRNPFVDCPYAVGAIWDSSHASDYGTKGQYTSGDGVAISKSSASIAVNGTTTISATSSNSGNISWSSDKTNIATVSKATASSGESITITGVAAGTAKITASITISGTTYSQICNVTVTDPKTLSSITVENPKTSYTVGDTFVKPTVTATFSDSSTDNVKDSAVFSGYNLSQEGNQTVSVSYTYNNVEKTTSYAITVSAASSEDEWVATALSSITSSDIFVIVGNNGSNYAMSNNNGTGSAPSAVSVTVSNNKITSDVADNIKWKLNVSNSGYTFYPGESTTTWLYSTNTNNGVRVGTDSAKVFTLDESGYLKNASNSRYLGIYNSQDWRCYTSTGSNIANQTFAFYKLDSGSTPTPVETFTLTYHSNTNDTVTGMPTPNPVTGIESGSDYELSSVVPSREGYTFGGWAETAESTTAITEIENIQADQSVYAIWDESSSGSATGTRCYHLVTSASDLAANAKYLITNSKDYANGFYAMSTNQRTSNRGTVQISADKNIAMVSEDDVQVVTLGTSSDKWTLSVSGGYLYASASKSNELKTKTTLDDNGKWAITISNGVASIVAQGANTRNVMQFNYNNGNPLFACYGTASQNSVYLYRLDFEETLLTNVTCSGSGSHSLPDGYTWNTDLKAVYTDLPSAEKTALASKEAAVGSGLERYDYIIGKYNKTGLTDPSKTSYVHFITGRSIQPVGSSRIMIDQIFSGGNATVIIIVIGVVALSALGGYIFIRKRKES